MSNWWCCPLCKPVASTNCDCIGNVPDEIILTVSGLASSGLCGADCEALNGVYTLTRTDSYDGDDQSYNLPCSWYYELPEEVCGFILGPFSMIGVEVWPIWNEGPSCIPIFGLRTAAHRILQCDGEMRTGPLYPTTLDGYSFIYFLADDLCTTTGGPTFVITYP